MKALYLDRCRRGKKELKILGQTDRVIVSHGKSGRTWLRVMLSRALHLEYGLDEHLLIDHKNFHKLNRKIPTLTFTTDHFLADHTGDAESKKEYRDKRVLLLVRDPRDILVSSYFQWKHRMAPEARGLKFLPERSESVSPFEFAMGVYGTSQFMRIIRFLNTWGRAVRGFDRRHVVRYEDIRSEPEVGLASVLEFFGIDVSAENVRGAVEFADFQNMQKLERDDFFAQKQLRASDTDDPDTFKTRRGKVGGYVEYFSGEERRVLDDLVRLCLLPEFGYGEETLKPCTLLESVEAGAETGHL